MTQEMEKGEGPCVRQARAAVSPSYSAMLRLLLLLCSLALILSHVVHAQNCTWDDYKASYTECTSSNTRDLVYYKKADSNCTNGATVTPPVSFPL